MQTESDGTIDAEQALLRDEAALANGAGVVRTAVFGAPCLTLGVSQRMDAPCAERARALGVSVMRRASGGTGVLHEAGDVLWSVVLPRSDPRVGRDFVRAYERFGAGVVRWLDALGHFGARWIDAPGLSNDFCLFGSRGRVLALGGRVLGGAAQHATARAVLHHGSVGSRVRRDLLVRIFDVAPADLAHRLGSLEDLGVRVAPETLAVRLAEATRRALDA